MTNSCLSNNFTDKNSILFTIEDIRKHIVSLNFDKLSTPLEIRDYQEESVLRLLNEKNSILISPTSCLDEDTEITVKLSKEAFDFIKEFSGKIDFFYEATVLISLKDLEILVANKFIPQIDTPTGYESITQTYRKIAPGRIITFTDLTSIKCAEKHLILLEGHWTFAKDLILGQCIDNKIIHSIEFVREQEWVDFTIDAHHHSYKHNGMIHHNSGKSLIMFILITFLLKNKLAKKFLITVPTTSLVDQLTTDFISYCAYPRIKEFVENQIHMIRAGCEKETNKALVISTFQSAITIPNLEDYDFVSSDEVHVMSKDSGQHIYEHSINTNYRMGFTGTLQDTVLDTVVLEGLIGRPFQIVKTAELIKTGKVSNLNIEIIVLKYCEIMSKFISTLTYQEEYEFIITSEMRMNIITDFIDQLNKNTLILFTRIEKQGDILFKTIQEKSRDKIIIYLTGKNTVEERENARVQAEQNNNVIIIASYGIYAQGVSIKNIHNIVFASPYKAKIKVLQSIGRGLRLHSDKDICTVYDFVDNAKYKNKNNYLLDHFMERYTLYKSEEFNTQIIKHPIEIN